MTNLDAEPALDVAPPEGHGLANNKHLRVLISEMRNVSLRGAKDEAALTLLHMHAEGIARVTGLRPELVAEGLRVGPTGVYMTPSLALNYLRTRTYFSKLYGLNEAFTGQGSSRSYTLKMKVAGSEAVRGVTISMSHIPTAILDTDSWRMYPDACLRGRGLRLFIQEWANFECPQSEWGDGNDNSEVIRTALHVAEAEEVQLFAPESSRSSSGPLPPRPVVNLDDIADDFGAPVVGAGAARLPLLSPPPMPIPGAADQAVPLKVPASKAAPAQEAKLPPALETKATPAPEAKATPAPATKVTPKADPKPAAKAAPKPAAKPAPKPVVPKTAAVKAEKQATKSEPIPASESGAAKELLKKAAKSAARKPRPPRRKKKTEIGGISVVDIPPEYLPQRGKGRPSQEENDLYHAEVARAVAAYERGERNAYTERWTPPGGTVKAGSAKASAKAAPKKVAEPAPAPVPSVEPIAPEAAQVKPALDLPPPVDTSDF